MKKQENQAIHEACKTSRVKKWEVAEVLGLTDVAFSRMLRRELPEKEQQAILGIIKQLAQA